MKFWDTSALIPLCVVEPESERLRAVARDDEAIAVWWATRTECFSALARLRRERRLPRATLVRAQNVISQLAAEWSELLPTESLRRRAERLLAVHALRAADAFQLAAALVWSRGETASHSVVCLDERLRDAADREGFMVLPS